MEREVVMTDMLDQPLMEAAPAMVLARKIPTAELAVELMERARTDGAELVGPGGFLAELTKRVLEAGLDAEMTEHVGYDTHDRAGHHSENSRNGTRTKTVITDIGPVQVDVPRDRTGTFEPIIVRKRQRRLGGVDQMVLSLSAQGLTHGEICAHLEEICATRCRRHHAARRGTEPGGGALAHQWCSTSDGPTVQGWCDLTPIEARRTLRAATRPGGGSATRSGQVGGRPRPLAPFLPP